MSIDSNNVYPLHAAWINITHFNIKTFLRSPEDIWTRKSWIKVIRNTCKLIRTDQWLLCSIDFFFVGITVIVLWTSLPSLVSTQLLPIKKSSSKKLTVVVGNEKKKNTQYTYRLSVLCSIDVLCVHTCLQVYMYQCRYIYFPFQSSYCKYEVGIYYILSSVADKNGWRLTELRISQIIIIVFARKKR